MTMLEDTMAESSNGQASGQQEPLSAWETRYSKAKMARQQFERQWYLNIAFYFGKQWVTWQYSVMPTSLGQLIEPPQNRSRTRITVNRIRKIIRKELARLNKERVRGFVNPNTTDTVDVSAARAADKLVEYLTDTCNVADAMKRADFWMLLCGTAFCKDYYSNTENVGGALGGPVVEAVSPFHIFVPNLDEPDIERQPWVMHVVVRDPEFIAKEYGVVPDETMTLASSTVESRLMTVMGMTDQQAKQKGVEVKEVWVKPGDHSYPEGLHLVYIKGKVLQAEPFPYAHQQFPFTRRQYIESGMFYADSIIVDEIPIQLEYNRTRSQIIEDKNKMAKPMLSAVEGSISPRKIRNVPGEIILHKPGTNPPQPIPLVGLPAYVIEHLTLLRTEMDELASQQSQDGKQLPPGVTAATAIAYLQEDESSLVMDSIRDKEKGWQKVIQHFLSYVGQYWDAQHMVKTVGQNENFEAFNFSQSDLKGQTDWRVVPGSATPRSYPAQQAQIMELLKMGVVPAPMALNSLDLGDTDRLYEEMQVDVREADLENAKMAQKVPQNVANFQEHLQHIMRHDFYRKGQESQEDPQIDMLFNNHTFIHIIFYLMETNPMVQFPWPPQIVSAIRNYQMPADDAIMLQARGLLHAAAMGMLGPAPAGPGGPQPAPPGQPPEIGAQNAGNNTGPGIS